MEQNNTIRDPFFDEAQVKSKFSFDFVLWFYRILKYWYLFAISLILFLGYAYIKNKSWKPYYTTTAKLMIEPRNTSIGVAMGTVPSHALTRGLTNQQMILTSYEMIAKTVDRLPQLQVDYFRTGKFRSDNLYGMTPITIECSYIAPSAYNYVYTIEPINNEKCRIYYAETGDTPPFSMEIPYGELVPESRFFIRIRKTERFTPNFIPFNFRFVSKNELVARYSGGRIQTGQYLEGASVLAISMVGDNSKQDVDFLTALLDEFEIHNLSLKNEAADKTIAFIDKQLEIISDSLRFSELLFHDFQERTGIYKLESDDNRQRLNGVLSAIGENRAKEAAIIKLTEVINSSILSDEELIDPASLGLGVEAQVGGPLSQYVVKYNEIIKKMKEMGGANPLYSRSEKELFEIKMNILNGLKNIQNQIQLEKEDLENISKTLQVSLDSLPAQEREFLRYERHYKINESYDTYLKSKKYEASIQKASNVPDNYILEKPRQQGGAVNTGEKEQNYLMFFAIGLVIPLAFVVCKEELFNYSISTKEECEKISGLPVIGTIENIAKKQSTGAVLVKNFPKSSFAESFRNMRVRLEYITQKESSISLLVTSAEPADGKTFVAANVASVYQLTGKRVILVDFDLRRPSVGKNLNIHSKKGVSNYLVGQVSLDEIILVHPEFGFDVVTVGTLPPNPSELIKTQKTKDLIDYLKATYDYVILDCSPIGLVSDAYILSKYVDSTLFVIRRAKTNKAFFKSVITQVRDDGLERFALVFNDVKGREGYYGTSRYYGDKSYYLKRNSYYHDDYFEK
ncbi:polysaccharide biosynthesis tyrosine autokinase [Dysgonomonas sp. 216]|uniref:exopolysaccharide transport family protein n=1 Tax=Dysgonomonas sp. 216 TaxID=2302934 RepID=UPI0013CF8CF4|nr:tyrosine-protein kinase [Dysgonomonas sp. 216]NDW18388.1 polysaccharide biosynthesis tyrosine autokinase [Dysgonomonas sp. 216]